MSSYDFGNEAVGIGEGFNADDFRPRGTGADQQRGEEAGQGQPWSRQAQRENGKEARYSFHGFSGLMQDLRRAIYEQKWSLPQATNW